MVSTGHTSSSSFPDTSQNNHQDSCGTSGRKRDRLCKVVGCSVDLCALNKPYCLKRGVCPQHLKAESVRCKGAGEQLWRFCQQCGKMERLQQFQGKNRSCKAGLARRRQKCMMRQQQQQDWQQLQAMQQQEQQVAECGNASCSMFGWHVPAELAVQQAPAGAACSELPWTPPTIGCHGRAIGDGSSAHSATLPAPLAMCGLPAAALMQQQPADQPRCSSFSAPPKQLGCNAATAAAQAAPAAAPLFSSSELEAWLAAGCDPQGSAAAAAACISDAELDAIIAEELLAAGLQIGCGPAGIPTVAPISAPYAQPAAAAAADVAGAVSGNPQLPATTAAQYAKLHALMAELESLQATLQQLQQEQGVEQQVVSAATRF